MVQNLEDVYDVMCREMIAKHIGEGGVENQHRLWSLTAEMCNKVAVWI